MTSNKFNEKIQHHAGVFEIRERLSGIAIRKCKMNIDVEFVKQAISTFGMVISALKQAKDLLPDGEKKNQINERIEQAERHLKIAEAQAAQSMGYLLCRNHFPPGIMFSSDNKNWKCPDCGNTKTYQKGGLGSPWNSLGK